jgi:cytochrome c553
MAITPATPLFAGAPDGKTIAMQGGSKGAASCATCHGKQGEGNASNGYPYLANLPADYIKSQLKAYTTGTRKNPVMKPIATSLTSGEIQAVADYYAGLKNPKLAGAGNDKPAKQSQGAHIAHNGKWEAGVPSCFKCHGPNGKGVPPHFPPIAGQPKSYLKNQLIAWQKGDRSNDPIGLMHSVAKNLNANEINAVAQYLAQSQQ